MMQIEVQVALEVFMLKLKCDHGPAAWAAEGQYTASATLLLQVSVCCSLECFKESDVASCQRSTRNDSKSVQQNALSNSCPHRLLPKQIPDQ